MRQSGTPLTRLISNFWKSGPSTVASLFQVQGDDFVDVSRVQVFVNPLEENGQSGNSLQLNSFEPHPLFDRLDSIFLHNLGIVTLGEFLTYGRDVLPIKVLDPATMDRIDLQDLSIKNAFEIEINEDDETRLLLAGVESAPLATRIGLLNNLFIFMILQPSNSSQVQGSQPFHHHNASKTYFL